MRDDFMLCPCPVPCDMMRIIKLCLARLGTGYVAGLVR